MAARSLISLGANLGNSRQLIQLAGEMIGDRFGSKRVVFSRMYRSPAVGGPAGQDDFYNAVAVVESSLDQFGVWQALHKIEQTLGRQRRLRWEARRIDLDVLLHEQERLWTPTLKIPHPRMSIRTFVLEPAAEIAADWIEPVTNSTIEELRDELRRLSPLVNTPRILLLTESETTYSFIRKAQPELIQVHRVGQLDRRSNPRQVNEYRSALTEQLAAAVQAGPRLIAFAGSSPDPTGIHWEDYCRVWADVFHLNRPLVHPKFSSLEAELRKQPGNHDDLTQAELRPQPRGEPTVPPSHPAGNPAACAARLELDGGRLPFDRIPKYLLSADDPQWAIHELQAALTAMTCEISPCGDFFDAS